jgi:1-acyl-sn-glycerol-3-phosphate acyltransferase
MGPVPLDGSAYGYSDEAAARPPQAAAPPPALRQPRLRCAVEAVLRGYMRGWHRLEVLGGERLPAQGPALVLTNHVSVLDVIALAAANPYPLATTVIKAEMFRLPLLGCILAAWDAIPVERDGQDTAALRALLVALRRGRVVGLAAEGRRSRRGRLEAVHPVLARVAARAGVPVVPVGITGSWEALPPGAVLPRRRPVCIRVGEPLRFAAGTTGEEAARRIGCAIAALLPADRRPLDMPAARGGG